MKVLLILSLLVALSFSATIVWSGANFGVNRNFNNPNNWFGGVVPGSADIAVFDQNNITAQFGNIFITSATSQVQEIQFLPGVQPAPILFLQDTTAVALQVTNVTWSSPAASITVTSGCTLTVTQYALLNGGQIQLNNVGGTININGARVAGTVTLKNTGTNNVVFNTAANPTVLVNGVSSLTFPATGFNYGASALNLYTETAGQQGQIVFNYQPTIAGTWTVNNNIGVVFLQFNQGVNFAGATITVANNGGGQPRPTVSFNGIITTSSLTTVDAIPSFGLVTVNGAGLVFADKNPIFNGNVYGSGALTFTTSTNNAASSGALFVTFVNPLVTFTGPQWTFVSNTFVWNATYTFNQNWILNASFVVNFPLTITNGFQITIPSQVPLPQFAVYDQLTSNIPYTFNNWNGAFPQFRCNLPANTFAFQGTNTLNFPAGFSVAGCTVTATNSLVVTGGVVQSLTGNNGFGNSTLLPQGNSAGQLSFTTTTSFSAPAQSSLTLPGNWITNSGNDWTVNSGELIIGGTFSVVSGTNNVNGAGILTVAGNALTFQGTNQVCNVATLTFNNQAVTLSSAGGILQLGSILYLRNTILQGTSEIYFNNAVVKVTKGSSSITNPNFRFKSGLISIYQFDGFNPNSGAVLNINSGITTVGGRIIEGGNVIATTSVNIVFTDIVTFNVTTNVDGGNGGVAPVSGVTFMGPTTAVQNGVTVTFTNNIFLNATGTNNNIWNGNGQYIVSNSNIFLLGNWNPSSVAGTAPVTFNGALSFYFSANAIIGPNIVLPLTNINFFDTDGNDLVPAYTVTLEGSRNIAGTWLFGCNIIVGGSLSFSSTQAQNIKNVGYLQVNGNSISLFTNILMYNQLVLTQATTISSNGGSTLTLGEFDSSLTPHGFTVPVVGINLLSGANLIFGTSSANNYLVVTVNGPISGAGQLQVALATLSTSTSNLALSVQTQVYNSATLSGSGSFVISAINPVQFQNTNNAFTTATITTPFITSIGTVTLTGFVFTSSPVNFQGIGFIFTDSRNVNSNWVANVPLTFNGAITLGATGGFSGTATLTFTNNINLSGNYVISTNPVTFGINSATNFVIVGGTGQLTLSNTQTTILSRVVSGGPAIVSTSPNNYIHKIIGLGSNKGVMPPEWTWSNQIQLGFLNVTGPRTLTVPVQLTNGVETVFPDGVIINTNGAITYDLVSNNNNQLRVETFFTVNTPSVLPNNIIVTISGQNFVFNGTSTLQLNGTFNCQTLITFNTPVVFGYNGAPNPLNFQPFCCFLNPATPLQIYRSSILIDSTGTPQQQNNLVENSITFGLVPPLSTTFTQIGANTLLLKGNITISGNKFVGTGNLFLNSITVTTLQNSTLSNINPNSSLTFASSTSPWVEPQVSFFGPALNQVINLQGPIQLVTTTVGPQGAFFPSFPTTDARYPFCRVAFVDSVTFNQQATGNRAVYYYLNVPHQFYVSQSGFNFNINLGGNFLQIGHASSTFSKFGYGVPNVVIQTSTATASVRFLIGNSPTGSSVTFGDVTLVSNVNLRISSGSLTSTGKLTVNNDNALWVESPLTVGSLIFSQSVDKTRNSLFQYTFTSSNPTNGLVTATYTFFAGNATVNIVNAANVGTSFTAITSSTANVLNGFGGGQFNKIAASPGYTVSQVRSGNNMQFTITSSNPTVGPTTTNTQTQPPADRKSTRLNSSH